MDPVRSRRRGERPADGHPRQVREAGGDPLARPAAGRPSVPTEGLRGAGAEEGPHQRGPGLRYLVVDAFGVEEARKGRPGFVCDEYSSWTSCYSVAAVIAIVIFINFIVNIIIITLIAILIITIIFHHHHHLQHHHHICRRPPNHHHIS